MVWGWRRKECSGWGTHVYLWQIHFDIWQNQYNIVKLKKKNKNNRCRLTDIENTLTVNTGGKGSREGSIRSWELADTH